ncbi:MAG: alpha/beta hydrolase [Parvularculaceae bacterium]
MKSDGPSRGTRIAIEVDAGMVAGWRWRNDGAPRLLFCHANGFCASAYRRLFTALADRFDIIAPDLRGHGRTTLPAEPRRLKSWSVYGADIRALIDRLRPDWNPPYLLGGHSLGAVSVTLAAEGRSDIAGLMLIEPVAPPEIMTWIAGTPLWPLLSKRMPLVRGALSRRAEWPDRDAAAAAYGRKRLFSAWADGCLADYLEDGLSERAGALRLSCEPAWEAANYAAMRQDFWRAVRVRPAPMQVLAADGRDTTVFLGARARFRRAGVEVKMLDGVGHLVPMEKPHAAAEFLASAGP